MSPEPKRRRLRVLLGVLLGVPLLAAVDGFVIEPRWLDVTTHAITLPVRAPLVIAQISDLHTHDADGFIEGRVRAALDEFKPDLIVLTGDVYDSAEGKVAAAAFVDTLQAPLGVWYAPGNWEHSVNNRLEAVDYLPSSTVGTLWNRATKLRDDLWLAGFDDQMAGTPKLDEGLKDVPDDVAVVGIFHSPAFFAEAQTRLDLAIAGHTHGGQVRLPGLPPYWLPPSSGPYVEGFYGDDDSRLYVSRGIGMSMLPVRFFCRPELAIFTVTPRQTTMTTTTTPSR